MSKRIDWLRLIVGYETVRLLPGEPTPDFQQEFAETFGDRMNAWRAEGWTDVPDTLQVDPVKGNWVADVLQLELQRAIGTNSNPAKRPNLRVGDWVKLDTYELFAAPLVTGRDGVRCETGDTGWRNSVTHLIETTDGSYWPGHPSVVAYATLIWRCPGHGQESGAPKASVASNAKAVTKGSGQTP